jgi:hypothetical protein
MRLPAYRRRLAVALLAGLIGGCQSTSHENAYPKDPLLLTKKPVDGKAAPAPSPVMTASNEPAAPVLPATALASMQRPVDEKAPANGGPFMPIPPHTGPTLATPVSRSPEASAPADVPGSRRQVPGKYGHAPDYTWLQGVIDKHYHGHIHLRYCDPTVADPYGGKVCLEDDTRLSQFQQGDVILVEGALVSDGEAANKTGWKHYRSYRIRDAWLVEHKSR